MDTLHLMLSDPGCYFELEVTEDGGFIESPNYPDDYPPNFECLWVLRAEEGERIQVRVLDAEIEPSVDCRNDALGVKLSQLLNLSNLLHYQHKFLPFSDFRRVLC